MIVGVTKCGTTSLKKWLEDLGHDVLIHQTLATIQSGTLIYQNHYSDRKPVLIFRNYHDRMRSFYSFYTDYGGSVKDSKGQTDKYDPHNITSQWLKYDPLIFKLEYFLDFPKLNSRLDLPEKWLQALGVKDQKDIY